MDFPGSPEHEHGLLTLRGQEMKRARDSTFVTRQSSVLSVGAVGVFAAYSGVIGLQSTLNFDESLGTTSLAICFVSTILMNVTVAPYLLKAAGPKKLVVLSDAAFILYTVANFYPAKFTLYPAAIVLGAGEALIWPAVTMFNTHFAVNSTLTAKDFSKRANLVEEKDAIDKKTRWFSGRFFSIFSIYLVIGNLMAYFILKLGVNDPTALSETDGGNSSEISLNSSSGKCGINDCYESTSTEFNESEENKTQVVDDTPRYALFAGYTTLQLCSLAIHQIFLRSPSKYRHQLTKEENGELSSEIDHGKVHLIRHLIKPRQILVSPLNIYNGMMIGFIFGDVTRSYIACPLGVSKIGLMMAAFGLASAASSFVYKFSSNYFGKNCFWSITFVTECSLLLCCYFWKVGVATPEWQILIFVILLGMGDCIRETSLTAIYPEYFKQDSETAFNVLSMLTALGLAIMFALGTHVCLHVKLIILLSLLTTAIVCYCVSEIFY